MVKSEKNRMFGLRLYNLITKRYRSCAQFARVIGVIPQAVTNWCNGRNFPSVGHLYTIRDVLGCSWSDLLDD